MTFTEAEIITVISTMGALGVAIVPVYITSRRKANELDKKIGEPNGHGSLTDMTEKILDLVLDLGSRMTRIERRLDRLESIVEEIDG